MLSSEQSTTLTLNDFKDLIEKSTLSKRVFIHTREHGFSLACYDYWNPFRFLWISSEEQLENKTVATVFKNALVQEYGKNVVESIFDSTDENKDWTVSRIAKMIQKADEIAEPTVVNTSTRELKRYPNARVVAIDEIPDSDTYQKIRRKVLKTADKYHPYIRIEETLNELDELVNEITMVANHISIRLPDTVDSEKFQAELQSKIPDIKIKVEPHLPVLLKGRYLILFKPTPLETLPKVLKATRDSGLITGPDFIMGGLHSTS